MADDWPGDMDADLETFAHIVRRRNAEALLAVMAAALNKGVSQENLSVGIAGVLHEADPADQAWWLAQRKGLQRDVERDLARDPSQLPKKKDGKKDL